MTGSVSSDDETGSYSMIDKIDRICDQFEKDLRSGSQPKIEDCLLLVEPRAQDQLLRELVAIDFQFARHDCDVNVADYLKRFPKSRDILQALRIETKPSKWDSQETPTSGVAGNTTMVAGSFPHLRNFKLLEVAGSGGFGTVWRAMDLRLQREVAVKIPRSDRADRVHLEELTREAQVAGKLRHASIISVHEVGEDRGTSFIVTDYINGMNLKEWKRKNSISPVEAAQLVHKLAIAIQYAHSNGVIHRDLKLANVLMDMKGEPHVADFGLAKRETHDDSLAVNGQVLGTPAYMAPEQARADHASIDERTDIYSLGVILYELITGRTPFRGDIAEILQQVREVPPVAPRSIKPHVPRDLEAICLKCMAKRSAERYQTAQALADDLFRFLNGETLQGIPTALPNRVWKWYRRNRRFVVSLSLVAFLVASVSSSLMAWRRGATQPTIPRWPVAFTTQPPGCEITVVALDPDTGEPDPSKIHNARGRTPLTTPLSAGDYLVVAVLDSHRFHEVHRHVPDPNESLSFSFEHLRWKKRSSGVIDVPLIRIPRPDVSVDMGFCEGTEQLVEPPLRDRSSSRTWRIPSFYVDLHELSMSDLNGQNALGSTRREIEKNTDEPSLVPRTYYHCVDMMEAMGKRLPTAKELFYLSHIVCPDSPPSDGTKDYCILSEKSVIEGLHSGYWEWTSTKPGGPFTGSAAIPESLGLEAMSRMIGSGNVDAEVGLTHTGFKVLKAQRHDAGVRGVRSIAPRRRPQDFAKIIVNPE